jgi:FRG domain
MQLGSVRDLLEGLENACPDAEMFRGQTRNWAILPGIGRYPVTVTGYDSWRVLHAHLISRFLRFGRPFFVEHPRSVQEAWVVAQHHGLPTRLLDTTTNPLKALFFAVNHPADDEHDGVLWAFSYRSWREELDEERCQYWDAEPVPFLPRQLNPRLTAQEGAFISYPLPDDCNALLPLEQLRQDNLSLTKFVVPAARKPDIRRELGTLGVQYRLLFPDLDGVARGIKLVELES